VRGGGHHRPRGNEGQKDSDRKRRRLASRVPVGEERRALENQRTSGGLWKKKATFERESRGDSARITLWGGGVVGTELSEKADHQKTSWARPIEVIPGRKDGSNI